MQLLSFGLNHHSAPVQIRERVAFPESSLQAALRDLAERGGAEEAAIISTCNRTEVYCRTDDPGRAVAWLAAYHAASDFFDQHLRK